MKVIQFPHDYTWAPLDLPTNNPLPMLSPLARAAPFAGTLTDEDVQWLRIGAGRIDMEIKWMFRLGDDGVLRLFRSWSGYEWYRARVIKKGGSQWVLTDLNIESDKRRVGNYAQLASSFEAVLHSCLALRKTVTNVPSSPENAAAATIPAISPKVPGLQSLEWELDSKLPARVVTLRLGDEQAHLRNVLAVKASVDRDCVRIDFDDGGRLWLRQPWRWAWLPDDCLPDDWETGSSMFWMTSGGALLWPGPQWGIDSDVAVWSAVTVPGGGGVQVKKLSTSGKKIASRNNTEHQADATVTITFSPPWVSRDAIAFAEEEPWTRHLSELWRQVALLGADPPPSQQARWQPPPRPAHLGGHSTELERHSNEEWMAWWAPALHLMVYVLGCQEPFAALTRRLDGDKEDNHEAWALLESWWGADLRGFAAWGLREGLDSHIAQQLRAIAHELRVAPVARSGSLADSTEAWTRLAVEAGVVLGRDGDSFHLRYHFLSPLVDTDDVDFLIPDDGPLVLNVPNYRGWYRALLEFEEAAERPVEVRITDWGKLGTFARPAPGRIPRLVPTVSISPANPK